MRVGSLGRLAVFAILLPGAHPLPATNVTPALSRLPPAGEKHSVTLTWKASPSPVKGYNVYRKAASESAYRKINSSLVAGLTYIDNNVESGATYHYVIRAVDARGRESINSSEFTAVVP